MTIDRVSVKVGVLLSAAALTATGCGSSNDDVAGTWSGRCTNSRSPDAQIRLSLGDDGKYSSSSTGADGESAGTYRVVDAITLNLTNSSGQRLYHYTVDNGVLTLDTTTETRSQTCKLTRA